MSDIIYSRRPDGKINWRAHVPTEFLYVKPEYQAAVLMQQGVTKESQIDLTKVEDNKLRIKLGGINHVAHLRGIKSVIPSSIIVTQNEVTSICTVEFVPNEENPLGLTVGAQASASLYSVTGKFQLYLATIAQNRAFVRAVKQALQINILGDDEVDDGASKAFEEALKKGENPLLKPAVQEEAPTKPDIKAWERVRTVATQKGFSFDQIKARAIDLFNQCKTDAELAKTSRLINDPNTWTGYDSLDGGDAYTILTLMEKAGKTGVKKK